MAQAIWKGHISFGLVSIPVALYSGERRTDLHFRMLDSRNQARIRYERVNDDTGDEVPWEEIVKGFEYDKGNYVLLSPEDFEQAAPETTRSIDIESFVDLAEIEYRYFEKPYYLVPTDKPKGYVLLRDTLAAADMAGIAKVVIRSRPHLAALIASGDALVLNMLRFQQELRSADDFKLPTGERKSYKISKKEQDMARQLVESMSAAWDPSAYHDDYRQALLDYIERKAKKGKTAAEPGAKKTAKKSAKVIDLTERLRKSVAESNGGKKKTGKSGGGRKKTASQGKSSKSTAKRSGKKNAKRDAS
jgi:DNA end-binding protein Ku